MAGGPGLTASPAAGFPPTLRILSQSKIFLGPMAFRQEWFPDPPGLSFVSLVHVCVFTRAHALFSGGRQVAEEYSYSSSVCFWVNSLCH